MKKLFLLTMVLFTLMITSCEKHCQESTLVYFDEAKEVIIDGEVFPNKNDKVSVTRFENTITVTSHSGKINEFRINSEDLNFRVLDYTKSKKEIVMEFKDLEDFIYQNTYLPFIIRN